MRIFVLLDTKIPGNKRDFPFRSTQNEPSMCMGFPAARMALPHDVLARLASLTGYDQMLEMDSISRSHNLGLAEIESQLAAFKSGKINTQPDEVADLNVCIFVLLDGGDSKILAENLFTPGTDNTDNHLLLGRSPGCGKLTSPSSVLNVNDSYSTRTLSPVAIP